MIALTEGRKPYRIYRTVLFTYKNGDCVTISETFGSWAAPNPKVGRHILDTFSATLSSGVGKHSDRSGGKLSMDWNPLKLVQKCGLGFSAP